MSGPVMGQRQDLIIRPSSLPVYHDCPRRSVAKLWPWMIQDAGYELRQPGTHIGAAVGTAVHKGAETLNREKLRSGETGRIGDACDAALDSFRERVKEGVVYDQATPVANTGEQQVVRMVRQYRQDVAAKIRPLAIETRLEASIGDGFTLSGQADTVTILEDAVRDLKTGAARPNAPQLGAYSLLWTAYNVPRELVIEDFLARVAIKKEQPGVVEHVYPREHAENEAKAIIGRIKRDVAEFRATGDAWAFPANPNSRLCSAKFCPAHGTRWCSSWRT